MLSLYSSMINNRHGNIFFIVFFFIIFSATGQNTVERYVFNASGDNTTIGAVELLSSYGEAVVGGNTFA